MVALEIRLFGNMELRRGATALTEFPSQKAKRLFAYVLLGAERLYQRELLAGVFWADCPEEQARKCLRNELWRLKKTLVALGPELVDCLAVHSGGIGFQRQVPVWLDVEIFERNVAPVLGAGDVAPDAGRIARLRAAVELYRGDLLDGCYDDWCLYRREELRLQYLSALELLMHHFQRARVWDLALLYGQRILAQDALLEHIHRDVIRVYAQMGERPAALRQYERCAALLRRELGVEPMPETFEVYQALLEGPPKAAGGREPAPAGAGRRSGVAPLASVRRAITSLDRARANLVEATRQLDAAGGGCRLGRAKR